MEDFISFGQLIGSNTRHKDLNYWVGNDADTLESD